MQIIHCPGCSNNISITTIDTSMQYSLELLRDELKFRQSHWWSLANKFTVAIIAMLILPFVHPTILVQLGYISIILPIFAFSFSLVATWILGAEYQRVRAVRSQFNNIAPPHIQVQYPTAHWYERLFGLAIGHVCTMIFLIGFTSLSVLDVIAIWMAITK